MKQGELAPKESIPILYLPPRDRPTDWHLLLKRWIKRYRPEAVFTDVAELKDTLEKMGCRIPRDIGLATTSVLDGNTDAGIYQNSQEIGKAAIETLISLIKHNYYGIPEIYREVLIDGRWVDGKFTSTPFAVEQFQTLLSAHKHAPPLIYLINPN